MSKCENSGGYIVTIDKTDDFIMTLPTDDIIMMLSTDHSIIISTEKEGLCSERDRFL